MQPVSVQVAHGQRGLAAIFYLHQYVLVGKDLPPLYVTTDAEKPRKALEVTLSGFRWLTSRMESPAPARPRTAIRTVVVSVAAHRLAKGASSLWMLGTEKQKATALVRSRIPGHLQRAGQGKCSACSCHCPWWWDRWPWRSSCAACTGFVGLLAIRWQASTVCALRSACCSSSWKDVEDGAEFRELQHTQGRWVEQIFHDDAEQRAQACTVAVSTSSASAETAKVRLPNGMEFMACRPS